MDSLPAKLPGKPKNTGVGSLSLLQQSSSPRNQTGASCIAGGFFTSWATKQGGGVEEIFFPEELLKQAALEENDSFCIVIFPAWSVKCIVMIIYLIDKWLYIFFKQEENLVRTSFLILETENKE